MAHTAGLIQVGDVLVSMDLKERKFVCDLNACKGACCIEGDAGAPLDEAECDILDRIYPEVEPYLTHKSRSAIELQGKWIEDGGEYETPLVNGKECAYVIMEKGIAKCGIEKAWEEGKIDFQKPISCHLYPVRITKMRSVEMEAINYETWSICLQACSLGKKLDVPVYQFLKEPLTRKYGEKFYKELCEIFSSPEL